MGKQRGALGKRLRPRHGTVAVLVVLGIVLIEEGCSNETDLAGPDSNPPRLAAIGDLSDESRFDHPMYDLPTGHKDMNDQLALAAATIPGGFGGSFKNAAGQTVVWIKDISKSADALNTLMGFQPGDAKSYHRTERSNVIFMQGTYDWRDLNAWFRGALDVWRDGVVGMDIDERTNKLYIGVDNTGIKPALERDLQRAGIPLEAVDIEYMATIVPSGGGPVPPVTELQTMTLRSNFDPPYHSGIQHGATGIPNDSTCTMGAIVRITSSINGYLTASHCTDVMFRDDGNDHFQPTIDDDNIGEEYDDRGHVPGYDGCDTGEQCRLSDAALVRFTTASDGSDRGHIARTTGIGSITLTSADDDEFTIYDDEPACPLWVNELNCFPNPVGTELHYVGRTSGWEQGELTRMCMVTAYRIGNTTYRIFCVDEVEGATAGGNSGAVALERTSDPYDVNMWGMLTSGRTTNDFWYISRIESIRQETRRVQPHRHTDHPIAPTNGDRAAVPVPPSHSHAPKRSRT
jgi:hypothetical protein